MCISRLYIDSYEKENVLTLENRNRNPLKQIASEILLTFTDSSNTDRKQGAKRMKLRNQRDETDIKPSAEIFKLHAEIIENTFDYLK